MFRSCDIHSSKSLTAGKKAREMNSDMNIIPLEQKVCPDTEVNIYLSIYRVNLYAHLFNCFYIQQKFFNDSFYDSIDYVCTALDNIEARLYVDQKCLFYHKPMFESGRYSLMGYYTDTTIDK